jgi:murein DD-endopeptidase MepM/ murein hydrolase activator NlpD
VHAAHDGVVDRVQRARNDEHGGQYVRLSHHGGTVFSQYFHLAAIPRGLEAGAEVKAGDVVGLLGDTGVKESAPHLHFTVSVRPQKGWPERYLDPEPLIALWPLRIPLHGTEVGLVTTVAKPGLPLGSAPLRASHLAKIKRKRAGEAAGKETPQGSPDDSESSDSESTVEE